MKMRVSVITSIYNGEKHIRESVSSILNQTFTDFEFIIVNDCSTDNTKRILQSFANKDNRIRLINNNKNIGLTKSLNKALKLTKGKYIARHDADDISLPQRLKKQYDFLENNPEIYLVGTSTNLIDEEETFIRKSNTIASYQSIASRLPKKNCIYHPTIMFRNNSKTFYREKFTYAQDYDLYLNLLTNGYQMSNLEDSLVKRRISKKSIGQKNTIQQFLFAQKARKFYQQRLKNGIDEYNNFKPNEILNLSKNSESNEIVKIKIWNAFNKRNLVELRTLLKLYIKNNGPFNQFSPLLIFSYLPKPVREWLITFFSKHLQ